MFNAYDDRSMSSSDESDNDITSDSSDSDSDEAELDKRMNYQELFCIGIY